MRVTFGTVGVLAASLLVATAFWPETRQAPVRNIVIAQDSPAVSQTKKRAEPATPAVDDQKAAVEAKLSKVLATIPDELSNVPFTQAIELLGELLDVDILIDQVAIAEEEIETNAIVSLRIKRTKVTARMALDLLLEPLKLSYTIRDGLIMVTTAAQANQIQVYNIRDLLPISAEHIGGGGAAPATPMAGMMGPAAMSSGKRLMRMGGMGDGMGGMGGGMGGRPALHETDSLAELIAATIDPVSWDLGGGNGSIIQHHELLVVKNSQTVHGKIKALLEMMRTSAKSPPGAAPQGGPAPRAQ